MNASAKLRGVRPWPIARWNADPTTHKHTVTNEHDWLAEEEPLQIRILGDVFLTTMRTPSADRQLVAGLLFTEGLITSRSDLSSLAHCGNPSDEGYGNTLDVIPAPGFHIDPDKLGEGAREAAVNAACGVCGRRSISELRARCRPLTNTLAVPQALPGRALAALHAEQSRFQLTGGTHAAALFSRDGTLLCLYEDVGRHNAVDKVIGHQILEAQTLPENLVLVVSGRCSFEIVQKACVARIGAIIAVSAPTSMAVETASELGITLIAFSRESSFNVYTGRIE